ncbi:type II secretion system F family protein [Campylobacter coli]
MKLYELEIKGKTKQTKHLRAKNLNEAQAKAIAKKWEILNIKEIQKASFKRLDDARFILFFQELSLLCEVGISIKDALKELDKIYSHKMIAKLCDNLNLGQNLSLAFENANFGLTHAELALIKTSQNTGKLSEIFMQISRLRQNNVENEQRVKKALRYPFSRLRQNNVENEQRVKKALRYPLIVFLSVCAAFVLLMLFVVPNFKDLFEDLNLALPFITELIIYIYNFLDKYILLVFCLIALILFLTLFLYRKYYFFSYFCDSLLLKLPLLSKFIIYQQNYSFFMIFSLLLKSGISLLEAFKLATLALNNKKVLLYYQEIRTFMDSGLEISHAFKKVDLFDPLVFSMLSIAMKSSKLEFLSEEIAKYYKNKSENLMDKFLSFLEPIMTLWVAILVLFLALGIFLPIWELSSGVNF